MDRKLAELLAQFPTVWDPTRKDYHDKRKVPQAFIAMAKEMRTSVTEVFVRYRELCEKYRREKARIAQLTASGKTVFNRWELFEQLHFLDDDRAKLTKFGSNVKPQLTDETTWQILKSNGKSITPPSESQKPSRPFQVEERKPSQLSQVEESEEDSCCPVLYTGSLVQDQRQASPVSEDRIRTFSSAPSRYCLSHLTEPPAKKQKTGKPSEGITTSDSASAASTTPFTNMKQPVQTSKFEWLGKYIAHTLHDMEPTKANLVVKNLINVLHE